MGITDWTPDEEQQMLREIGELANDNSRYVFESNQILSDNIAEILVAAPNIDRGWALAAGQAITSGFWTMEEAQQSAIEIIQQDMQDALNEAAAEAESPKSWWEKAWDKAFYTPFKASVRYGLGALFSIEQLNTSINARTQLQTPARMLRLQQAGAVDPTAEITDWKALAATTEIGAALMTGDTGEGFLIGGRAKEVQEQAALAYRGGLTYPEEPNRGVPGQSISDEKDVRAFTLGRNLALNVSQPGSQTFNVVSGAVDAAYALISPAPAPVKGIKKMGAALPEVIPQNIRAFRSTAGLTNFETPFIDIQRTIPWLNQSRAGRRLRDRVQEISVAEDWDEAIRLFPNADARTWNRIVNEAKDDESALRVLSEELGLAAGVRNIADINFSSWQDVKTKILSNPVARAIGAERAVTRRPGRTLEVGFATDQEITDTIRNANDWLKLLYADPNDRKTAVNRLANALLNNKGDVDNALREIQPIFTDAFAARGTPKELVDELFTRHAYDIKESNVYNAIDGETGAGDLYQALAKRLLVEVDGELQELGKYDPSAFANRGWLDAEHRRWTITMPDPERVYRATSNFNWLFSRYGVRAATGKLVKNPELPQRFLDNYGKARLPIAALDALHNKIWKRPTLGQGAYAFRLTLEGMFRQMFAPGIRSGPLHPYELITAAMFRRSWGKYKGTLSGKRWDLATSRAFEEGYQQFLMDIEPRIMGEIQSGMAEKLSYQTGAWREASRGSNFYVQGVADNIHLLANDRLSRLLAQGYTSDDIIQLALRDDKQIVEIFRDLEARHYNQVLGVGEDGNKIRGSLKFFDANNRPIAGNMEAVIEGYFNPRLQTFTRGDRRLLEIVANGEDGGRFALSRGEPFPDEVYAFQQTKEGLFGRESFGEASRPGAYFGEYGTEFLDAIRTIIRSDPEAFPFLVKHRVHIPPKLGKGDVDPKIADIVKKFDRGMDKLFAEVLLRPEAYLNRSPVWRRFYYQSTEMLLPQLDEGEAIKIIENLREAYRAEASFKYTNLRDARIGEDGLVRVEGYKRPMTDAQRMERLEKAKQRLDSMSGKFSDKWAANYIGSAAAWNRIKGMADGTIPSTGTRTLEEIDALSFSFAAEETKKLLYDVSNSSNIAESLTIISPFIKAWKEGITRWPKFLLQNPQEAKNLTVSFQGLREADPDNDGAGFIYTDPTTGEQVFNYPGGNLTTAFLAAVTAGIGATAVAGPVAGALAAAGAGYAGFETGRRTEQYGLEARYVAPVESLNMVFQVFPGVGPFVQIPLAKLLDANIIPYSDDFARVLLPFGSPQGSWSALYPSSVSKFFDALSSDPENTRYAASYKVEAMDALLMTGRYNLSDPLSARRLDEDAGDLARYMTIMRAMAQFVGPARPDIDLIVPTKFQGEITIDDVKYVFDNGSIPNSVLYRAYRIMQQEDPQNAAKNFINTFGDMSYGYLVGRTQTKTPGLSASREFGDWVNDNENIVNAFPEVYPYFAENVGDQYDSYTFQKQIRLGERERFTDASARLEDAQILIGRARYMAAVRAAGPDPNPQQELTLAQFRLYLKQYYPGFDVQELEPNEQQNLITRLERAVTAGAGDLLAGNKVAEGLEEYFAIRERAIDMANRRREAAGRPPVSENILAGNANRDLRAFLRVTGFEIARNNSGFERVWSDVLFGEVDI
jgi:hypothetical protein